MDYEIQEKTHDSNLGKKWKRSRLGWWLKKTTVLILLKEN